MEYINKAIPDIKQKAHKLLKRFIEGQWQQDANCYVNLAYEHFDNKELCKLLLNEQNHYCCYCMKHILDTETTLEHIIPNKATNPTIFNQYDPYGDISTNVFFWENSMRVSRLSKMPPFPHILAYENLVASCNGYIPDKGSAKCCNNKRGSKNIIPIFYIANTNEFKYDVDGKINCDHAKYGNTISHLSLEEPTLQLFRRCWLNLPSQYDALDVIEASEDTSLRDIIIDDMDLSKIDVSDKTTIRNKTYWKTFMNYFWFYLYKIAVGI